MSTKSTDDKNKQIRDVMIEAAQIQLAAMNATVRYWSDWTEAMNKFSQNIGEELLQIVDDGAQSDDVLIRLADLNRGYLRAVSELPQAAVTQFNNDLEKFKEKGARNRSARVKE